MQISEKSADFRIHPFLGSLKTVTCREPVHRVARSVFHITNYYVLHTHSLAGSLGRFKDGFISQKKSADFQKKVQISKKSADFRKKCRFRKSRNRQLDSSTHDGRHANVKQPRPAPSAEVRDCVRAPLRAFLTTEIHLFKKPSIFRKKVQILEKKVQISQKSADSRILHGRANN